MIRDILFVYIHGQYGTLETGHRLLKLLQDGQTLEYIIKTNELAIKNTLEFLKVCQSTEYIQTIYQLYTDKNIGIVTILDSIYPSSLLNSCLPPLVLFYKGNFSLFLSKRLGVVGHDTLTLYGEKVIKEIIVPLDDVVFVGSIQSKLSSTLFEYTIKTHHKNIVVLSTNFEHYFPLKMMFLQKKLEKDGLVLTEIPLGDRRQQPLPRLGELVAGVSSCVCVVETREHTLAMYTAYCSIAQSKDIIVAPVSLFEHYGVGNNQLLQQGAQYLIRKEDIVECLERSFV